MRTRRHPWVGYALLLALAGCGDSALPAFARPPPVDDASVAASQDAGTED